jgi:hypothetical protein
MVEYIEKVNREIARVIHSRIKWKGYLPALYSRFTSSADSARLYLPAGRDAGRLF